MRKSMKMLLAAGAVLAAVSAVPAFAQTRVIATIGSWTAFDGKTNENKIPLCGMYVSGPNSSLMVKWFKGSDHLTIHAFGKGWKIPDGTELNMSFSFDGDDPYTGVARGKHDFVEAFIGEPKVMDNFMREFRSAGSMRVEFPDGNVNPWQINMDGSRAVADIFTGCMNKLAGRSSPSTPQPFGKKQEPAAQPFGTKSSGSDRGT